MCLSRFRNDASASLAMSETTATTQWVEYCVSSVLIGHVTMKTVKSLSVTQHNDCFSNSDFCRGSEFCQDSS